MSIDDTATDAPPITVYWRPGCGFCFALLSRLEATDLVYTTVNIWEDAEGRAFVRSVAKGSETVPTVTVGRQALVNPTLAAIVDAAADDGQRRRRFRR